MTLEQERLSNAAKYEMPATDDYLAARCLLLNQISVGFILAHEAVEKLLKAVMVLELSTPIPRDRKGHDLSSLGALLLNKDPRKYSRLGGRFVRDLDQHYAWRYYDDVSHRSKIRNAGDIRKVDSLWIWLFERYLSLLPAKYRGARYLHSNLFNEGLRAYTNWREILLSENKSMTPKRISSLESAWEICMDPKMRRL